MVGLCTVPPRSMVPTKSVKRSQCYQTMYTGLGGPGCRLLCHMLGIYVHTTHGMQHHQHLPSPRGTCNPFREGRGCWTPQACMHARTHAMAGWLRHLLTVQQGALADRVTISWVSTSNSSSIATRQKGKGKGKGNQGRGWRKNSAQFKQILKCLMNR